MPEENKAESNSTEMGGAIRSAETARSRIRKTKRATRHRSTTEDNYSLITPHAIRSPAFPAGSVFMSSAFAWTTSAVPPLLKSEWLSLPRFTQSLLMRSFALPSALTVKLIMSPA